MLTQFFLLSGYPEAPLQFIHFAFSKRAACCGRRWIMHLVPDPALSRNHLNRIRSLSQLRNADTVGNQYLLFELMSQ
ncbi:MAG: hypothetical protein U0T81_04480 [Saprospiraceae bacterium]